jgi:hypothetical protein
MFVADMGPTADELQRLADEVRASRERLQELLRITAELRRRLNPESATDNAAVELQSAS